MSKDLKIEPEFAAMLPPLSQAELDQLEMNIMADGCREPVVIWKGHGIILEGHNRYRLCKRNGLDFQVVEQPLAGREEARNWILEQQLGRRNLTALQRGALRAEEAEAISFDDQTKLPEAEPDAPAKRRAGRPKEAGSVRAVATKQGVSTQTVHSDRKLKKALDAMPPEERAAVKTDGRHTKKGIIAAAEPDEPPFEPDTPEVTDDEGTPVTDSDLIEVFKEADRFGAARQLTSTLRRDVKTIGGLPSGRELDVQAVDLMLRNVSEALRFACPHIVTPEHVADKRRWLSLAQARALHKDSD